DTCARYSDCLASASLLGFGRRRLLARAAAAPTSSLDFLQGTFEKIRLQRLFRQHPLQLSDFRLQLSFLRRCRRSLPVVHRLQLSLPPVQHGPMNPQLVGQLCDVCTGLQPLHGHLAEGFRESRNSLLSHLQLLSSASVAMAIYPTPLLNGPNLKKKALLQPALPVGNYTD